MLKKKMACQFGKHFGFSPAETSEKQAHTKFTANHGIKYSTSFNHNFGCQAVSISHQDT
jgi:hypothetical protein